MMTQKYFWLYNLLITFILNKSSNTLLVLILIFLYLNIYNLIAFFKYTVKKTSLTECRGVDTNNQIQNPDFHFYSYSEISF